MLYLALITTLIYVFQLMTELGNELVNGILEANVDSFLIKKLTPNSSRYNTCTLVINKMVNNNNYCCHGNVI